MCSAPFPSSVSPGQSIVVGRKTPNNARSLHFLTSPLNSLINLTENLANGIPHYFKTGSDENDEVGVEEQLASAKTIGTDVQLSMQSENKNNHDLSPECAGWIAPTTRSCSQQTFWE